MYVANKLFACSIVNFHNPVDGCKPRQRLNKWNELFKNNSLLFLLLLSSFITTAQTNPAQYIDPFIGTSNDANTYPGATVPWGMVSVNPFNIDNSINIYNATSYRKGGGYIYGFSHTRLSGVGCPDMSSILLMPAQGKIFFERDSIKSNYNNEIASAGYYAVDLLKHNIKAEVTATIRTGISQYTFSKGGKSFIMLDAGGGLSKMKGSFIHKISNSQIEGYKTDGGFCGKPVTHKVYFFAEINKQAGIKLWDKEKAITKDTASGNAVGAWFVYDAAAGEKILVKVGISYLSMANARLNLQQEQPEWDFEAIKNNAVNEWNKELSRIKVEGSNEDDKKIFYTGIYHILQHPNIINDVNGEYPAMGSHKTVQSKRNHYTVFSLWDTYRNVHPFLTLVYPERQSDMVASMIDMYKQSGWLPKWELAANETLVMVGDPVLPVIADTYLKGIKKFDVGAAYKAMLHNAKYTAGENYVRPGLKQYLQYGFIPNNDKRGVWGSVSTTLEYCFADWSLAQMAKALNKKTDYKCFTKRSFFYKNLYDSTTGFLRPRLKNKLWQQPFDPATVKGELDWNASGGPGFAEGSAWQYNFLVPHDINGLKRILGGDAIFTSRLQKTFDSSYFVLWNEPDMAYPYLFNYVKGQEWGTQKAVSENIKKHFNTTSAGIPGNDDCGTMSAWLVFGMMGFYPDCPASLNYALTTPAFDKITIALNPAFYKGKKMVIEKKGAGAYIKNMRLNNQPYKNYFITHSSIVNGGSLQITTMAAPK